MKVKPNHQQLPQAETHAYGQIDFFLENRIFVKKSP